MSRRWLPIAVVACLGCGGTPPAPAVDPQGAARIFATARDLEARRETKRSLAAYHQVVRYYPDSPEARAAALRISATQQEAGRRVLARRRK